MNAKRRFDRTAIAVASVFGMAVGLPAYAATTSADKHQQSGKMQEQQQNQQQSGKAQQQQNQQQSAATQRNMRASNLIGKDVRNAQGEKLGDIEDLIINMNDSRVHYAVLSFGGFMGMGDKLFAYPMRAFQLAADKDELVLNVDKEKLKNAPGFDKAQLNDWNKSGYPEQVDRYYGEMNRTPAGPNAQLVHATDLIGKDLNARDGRDAGEIQDLVVNVRDGNVAYAVVAFDKTWGPEDKRYAVPLRVFNAGKQMKDDFVVDMNPDMVAQLPSFERNRWPDLNDSRWANQVDRFALDLSATGAAAAGAGAAGATARNDRTMRDDRTMQNPQAQQNAARQAQQSEPQATRQVQQSDPQAARRAPQNDQQASFGQHNNMRLSTLVGTDVRNAQGEQLGEIQNVIVDINNGRVHYVVLSFGGFLGIGDKHFAYPVRLLQPAAGKDALILNVDSEALKRAPGFEQASRPDWNRPQYREQVDRYFGEMVRVEPRPNMRLIEATNLMGKDVVGTDGRVIGEVEDAVVSLADGNIRYAVVGFDGWGVDERRYVFPLRAFRTGPRLEDNLVLNVNRDMLARVPSFTDNQWPDLNNVRWTTDVDRYLLTLTVTPLPSARDSAAPGQQRDANLRDRVTGAEAQNYRQQ